MRRAALTAVMFWMAAGAARAQAPAMPERRLYQFPDPYLSHATCAVLRDGTLVTVFGEWYDDVVARFFDPLGDPRLLPVVVAHEYGREARVAARGGGFVTVWFDTVSSNHIVGQAFASDGAPVGGRFAVGLPDFLDSSPLEVKGTPDRGFIVAWTGGPFNTPEGTNVWARRFSPAGVAGAAFQLNGALEGNQSLGGLDVAADGSFTVSWLTTTVDSQGLGIFARRFDAAGAPLGPDIQVSTSADDRRSAVAVGTDGTSLVAWQRGLFGSSDVYGRRYDAAGTALGSEFKINAEDGLNVEPQPVAGAASSFTVAWRRASADNQPFLVLTRTVAAGGTLAGSSALAGPTPALSAAAAASDGAGGFTLCWRAGIHTLDDFFNGAVARRYAALAPSPSTADDAPSQRSNGNGIIDTGERVPFRPTWRNHGTAPVAPFTGRALALEIPCGNLYTIYDDTASYEAAGAGASTSCAASGDCYELSVDFVFRAAPHCDAMLDERLSTGQLQRWRLHVGRSFWDVENNSPYYRFAETLMHNGVTSGCDVGEAYAAFCPTSSVTREQLAPFVLVAHEGAGYRPDLTPGPQRFTDVPTSSPFYPFIEELARRGVVTGCTAGTFCPQRDVTRAEATVIVLRTLDGQLMPPACGTPMFSDVPASSPFCRWVEELARRGVVNGCAAGRFCPDSPVLREQMAVVLTQAFGLSAYSF